MKFLADENVEWPIIVQMRQWGHDVLSIKEALPGKEDDAVLALSQKETRILLTNDLDFGRIVIHQKKNSPGVVLMRFDSEASNQKIKALGHLLQHHSEKLMGHFTVISEKRIKIRPLAT